MPEQSPNEKGLWTVFVLGTAISFGVLGAIIGSMKGFFHGDATFVFSFRTIVGFVIGFVAGWLLWKFVRSRIAKSRDEG
jgi:hypothetical protein